jgi:hypothetical protein
LQALQKFSQNEGNPTQNQARSPDVPYHYIDCCGGGARRECGDTNIEHDPTGHVLKGGNSFEE